MKLTINLEKKSMWIAAVLFSIIAILFVHAYGGSAPTTVGHSAGEVEINVNGTLMTLQQAVDSNLVVGDLCRIVVGSIGATSTANCNSNEYATGGGGICSAIGETIRDTNQSNSGHSWSARCTAQQVTAYVICCKF